VVAGSADGFCRLCWEKAAALLDCVCVTYLEVSCTSQHGQYDGEGVFRVDEGDVKDWACVY
jgi:hypothetical protein